MLDDTGESRIALKRAAASCGVFLVRSQYPIPLSVMGVTGRRRLREASDGTIENKDKELSNKGMQKFFKETAKIADGREAVVG